MSRPRIIAIAGPTASGKSSLALTLARRLAPKRCSIIGADSKQVYKGLPTLCACPTAEEKEEVSHHLYEYVHVPEIMSAWQWAQDVRRILSSKTSQNYAIIVGGAGLYFRALFRGLSWLPPVPEDIRQDVFTLIQTNKQAAYDQLKSVDPRLAAAIDPHNGRRIARGLEVYRSTGQPLSRFFERPTQPPLVCDVGVLILPPKEIVLQRARERFAAMLDMGVTDEVRSIADRIPANHPLARATGLQPIAQWISNTIDRDTMIDEAVKETAGYIKKQYTWFHRQMDPRLWTRLHSAAQAEQFILKKIF